MTFVCVDDFQKAARRYLPRIFADYIEGGAFSAAMFFAEVEGHPDDRNVRLALEEASFFSSMLKVLGVYPAAPFRRQ